MTLIVADCLDALATMPPGSVDLVVTSPPYNIALGYASYDDTRPDADYLDWMTRVAVALERVLAVGGSVFLNLSGSNAKPWLPFELITRLRPVFQLQNHITWIKSIAVGDTASGHYKPVGGARFLHPMHEHVFQLTKTGRVPLDRLAIGVPFQDKSNIARRGHARDLRCRGNTWFIPYRTVNSRAEKFHHPAGFPVTLPLWCIHLVGGQPRVLDPFAGAGTTLVAAARAGVPGIGIEIDPLYASIARDRLAADEHHRVTLTPAQMATLPARVRERGNQSTGVIALTPSERRPDTSLSRVDRPPAPGLLL